MKTSFKNKIREKMTSNYAVVNQSGDILWNAEYFPEARFRAGLEPGLIVINRAPDVVYTNHG